MKSQIKKGSKLFSIIHLKCPACHEGNLFSVTNTYHLKRMLEMPERCPVCRQDFMIEPGFYSGALWISYPVVLLIIIPITLVLIFYFQISIYIAFLIPVTLLFLLQPLIMRYSRAIWINIFVLYKTSEIDEM